MSDDPQRLGSWSESLPDPPLYQTQFLRHGFIADEQKNRRAPEGRSPSGRPRKRPHVCSEDCDHDAEPDPPIHPPIRGWGNIGVPLHETLLPEGTAAKLREMYAPWLLPTPKQKGSNRKNRAMNVKGKEARSPKSMFIEGKCWKGFPPKNSHF